MEEKNIETLEKIAEALKNISNLMAASRKLDMELQRMRTSVNLTRERHDRLQEMLIRHIQNQNMRENTARKEFHSVKVGMENVQECND